MLQMTERDKPIHLIVETNGLSILVLHERWPGATGLSGYNAMIRAGVNAYSISESDVIPLHWPVGPLRAVGRAVRKRAVIEFNRQLVRFATQLRPDAFLAFKGTFVKAESLLAMREMGIACVNFYPDVSFMSHGRYLPQALPQYDWVITTKTFGSADLRRQLGIERSSHMNHAYDPDVHQPRVATSRERELYGCDVSFIGTWSPMKESLLDEILRRRPEVRLKVFGSQWKENVHNSRLIQCCAGHTVSGVAYAVAIGCAKVNLGLLSEQRPGASSGDLITSRTFHIPAAGGALLHQRTSEVQSVLREGTEYEAFDGPDELCDQVSMLLSNETHRRNIAARGHDAVTRAHSWDHRAREIITLLRERVLGSASRAIATGGA